MPSSSEPMYFVKKIPTGCGSADEGKPSYESEGWGVDLPPTRFTFADAHRRANHYNGILERTCIASVVPAF